MLDGSVTTDNIGTIINAGGITEAGLIDNTGATLAVGSSGTLLTAISLISTGTVSGGTIVDANGDGFAFNGGTLEGVTYQGPLDLINPGDGVTIANGLTVTGTLGSPPGTIDLTGTAATLDLAATQTLDNVTLNIGNISPVNADGDVLRADQGGTVTLGRNASIDSLGVFATLLAETGTTLDLAGTLSALNGETVILADSGGTLSNDGSIVVNGGTIDVNTPLARRFGWHDRRQQRRRGRCLRSGRCRSDARFRRCVRSAATERSRQLRRHDHRLRPGFNHRSHQLHRHRYKLCQQCADADRRHQTEHPGTVQPERVRAYARRRQWHRHDLGGRAGNL